MPTVPFPQKRMNQGVPVTTKQRRSIVMVNGLLENVNEQKLNQHQEHHYTPPMILSSLKNETKAIKNNRVWQVKNNPQYKRDSGPQLEKQQPE